MPAAFTPAQMGQLARAADARMVLAARSAPDGEVIQFLAGAPELLARYRNAPPAAAALIDAAMDARRLGMGAGLPQAFLEAAAPGYLTDAEWDALGEDWLEQALAYTAVPCKGARGPLTRIRPRPARHAARNRGDQPGSMAAAAGPLYRLADYLDQHGRAHRASQIPPAEFWSAAAAHAAPGDQAALGDAAHARGLYRDAAQLHKNAAASGNLRAALYLSRSPGLPARGPPPRALGRRPRRPRRPGRRGRPAGQPAGGGRARAGRRAGWPGTRRPRRPRRPGRRGRLLDSLREAGAHEQAAALLARDPAAHAALDDPGGVASLLDSLREAGAHEQAAALLARDPAAHAPLDDPDGVAACWTACGRRARTSRPPRCWPAIRRPRRPRQPVRRGLPAGQPAEAGAHEQAAALAARAAAHAPLDDPAAVARLLDSLREAGAHEQAAALAARAAAHAALDDPGAVASLLDSLREAGADEQAAALLARVRRPRRPRRPGRRGQPAGQPAGGGRGRAGRRAAGPRPAAHAALDDPGGVASLLDSLREAGAHEQAAALLAAAAAHAALDDPDGVASLLDSLREAGADEQAAALLARDPAAHAALDDPGGVASLLDSLREAGAHEQAAALAGRLPAAGMFGLFLEQKGPADQFRFGREADGTPAAPWGWEDLDLWLVPRHGPDHAAPRTSDRLSLARPVSVDVDRRNPNHLLPGTSRPTLRAPQRWSASSQPSAGQNTRGLGARGR